MKKLLPYVSFAAIWSLLLIVSGIKGTGYAFNLGVLAVVAFIQNMAFTLVSRSRNSGDPEYHRYCAWGSNAIWFLCYTFLFSSILQDIRDQNWMPIIIVGVVYGLATAEGSVLMMRIAMKKESGKRKVGTGLTVSDIAGLEEILANKSCGCAKLKP